MRYLRFLKPCSNRPCNQWGRHIFGHVPTSRFHSENARRPKIIPDNAGDDRLRLSPSPIEADYGHSVVENIWLARRSFRGWRGGRITITSLHNMVHLSFLHFAHASMLLDCQLDIVYAAFLDCSHLLLIATTVIALQQVGSLHNAVHSPSG